MDEWKNVYKYISQWEEGQILRFVTTQVYLDFMLNEIIQIQENKYSWLYLYQTVEFRSKQQNSASRGCLSEEMRDSSLEPNVNLKEYSVTGASNIA